MVQFDSRGAIQHFQRAAQEDTTFRLPLIFAAHEHMDLGEYATADSIALSSLCLALFVWNGIVAEALWALRPPLGHPTAS